MNPTISVFANCQLRECVPTHHTLTQLVDSIRNPGAKVVRLCAELRAEPDKLRRRALKVGLPAITWAADLKTRRAEVPIADRELSRSGLICLDLDAVPDLPATRAALQSDPHVLVVFLSPSGDGLKVLVAIAGPWEAHWQALADYTLSKYQLTVDPARKDVHGLCFASHDPDLWMAPIPEAVEPFRMVVEEPAVPEEWTAPRMTSYSKDGETLADFEDSFKAREPLSHINPDLPYDEWIAIGQALHCQFRGGNAGLDLWNEWSARGSKYAGEKDVYNHYRSFKASGITFRTILGKAIEAGYKMPRREKPKDSYTKRVSVAPSSFKERIQDIISGKISSIVWPWSAIDDISQALAPGTATLFVGEPGSTKSFLLLQAGWYWQEIGVSFAFLELEQSEDFWKHRLLAIKARNGGFTNLKWIKANPERTLNALELYEGDLDRMMKNFTIGKGFTRDHIIQWATAQGEAGRRIMVIDPITAMDENGEKPSDSAKKLMDDLTQIAQKYGMSLIVITHNNDLRGLRGAPTLDHVAGGKGFTRFSDSVFWVSGTMDDDEKSHVFVRRGDSTLEVFANRQLRMLKTRSGAGIGEVIALHFDGSIMTTEEMGFVTKEKTEKEANREATKAAATDRKKRAAAAPTDHEGEAWN